MATTQDLREQHAILAKEATEFLNVNEKNWQPEHTEKWDAMEAQLTELENMIKRRDAMARRDVEEAKIENVLQVTERVKHGMDDKSRMAQFENALKTGNIPADLRAEMSTGTGSEGGYTVPIYVADRWIDALKSFGGMRTVSTILPTDYGNTIDYPTSDVTSQKGSILAENAQATALDPNFGVVSIPTYKFSSHTVAVPIELLQDAAFSISAFVDEHLIIRIGRATEEMFTKGTGDKQPMGMVNAAEKGKDAASTELGYDDLIDLQHSVDYAYRESSQCAFMMHDQTVAAVRKIKDNYGRPIFMPGYQMEGENTMVNRLLGVPVVVNNNMDPIGPGTKSILFGDFSRYIIRDVRAMQMLRMTDSFYATRGQVGFLILSRHGGNFVDAGGAVKYLAMPASATRKSS